MTVCAQKPHSADIVCASPMAESFEKHARTVMLLTLVSRVTGLARDASLSRVFGAGPLMDAFWFAFLVPNLFRRLFGEGALSAAFLPVYTALERDDPVAARALATRLLGWLILGLGGITVVGEVVLALIQLFGHESPALGLMMVMLPYMPLVCLVAILGAVLQVHGRFGPTAAAPVLLNLFIVGAAVGLLPVFRAVSGEVDRRHIMAVAIAVVVAGAVQVVWSVIALRGVSWRVKSRAELERGRAPFRQVMNQAWPMILGLGVLQLNTFLDGLIASYPTTVGSTIFGYDYPLDPGAMAALSYAQRLYEFPLGVFGIAVATAIFPALARAAQSAPSFAEILHRGLRLVVYIGLPASVGLILVREPLTAVVFQGGDFSAEETRRVAFVLMGYAPAIWAYSMTHVLTRAFYAKGDSRTPVKVSLGMVALNLVLNITLICTPLKVAGLAWSTAICAMIQVVVLTRLITPHAPHPVDGSVLRSWLMTGVMTIVMGGAVLAADFFWPAVEGWSDQALKLAVLVSIGGAIIALASLALRRPEFRWALGKSAT